MRRELAAVAGRCLLRQPNRRGFHHGARLSAAHNFTMPAMSPTMTEGNVASWKVKEGDTFSTGDVLLEIETDKASMDVEAQDEGIMAKILAPDGSKGVEVGTRIAVLAEEGDDVSSLEIPAEDSVPASQSSTREPPPPEPPVDSSSSSKAADRHTEKPSKPPGKAVKQTYPLYPSVIQLLHENNLELSEADKIPVTGPNGRLLKGDVLAYLGSIDASTPSKLSDQFNHLSHLDLSNINIRKTTASKPPQPEEPAAAKVDHTARIALTITFDAIREVQQKIHDALGIEVSLQTFITRAIEISNTELPMANRAPTVDELFDDILGLEHARPVESEGVYVPQMVSLAPAPISAAAVKQQKPDIIDIVTGTARRPTTEPRLVGSPINETSPSSVFALTVPKAEERRARVFLERMKTVLQVDPGRLVL